MFSPSMLEHLENIKQKLFLIESLILENGDKAEIRAELAEIKDLLEYLHGEEREWVLTKITEIENDLSGPTNRNTHRNGFKEENQQLDSYLSITLDNISNLREQRRYINRANTSLNRGGSGISSGIHYLKKLKERNDTDFKILLGGLIFLIFIIVFIWYSYK